MCDIFQVKITPSSKEEHLVHMKHVWETEFSSGVGAFDAGVDVMG